jgi:hypothetical protein
MGGATNIRGYLEVYGPGGRDVRVLGLCDVGEERHFQRGIEASGLGSYVDGAGIDRAVMEAHGFFVCVADLEDELIRALGADAVVHVIETQGELGSFRTFQRQPAQRGRTIEQHLRRFMGTHSGRKSRYARALVDALDLARLPYPLEGLLARVS